MTVYEIAQVAHEVNKAFCESIGDYSQLPWDEAADWQRNSAEKGVIFIINNPDAGADATHVSWMKQKLAEGWKYGPEKDPEKKEHPCIVPYDQLPTEQKSKDYIFRQIVKSLARMNNLNHII